VYAGGPAAAANLQRGDVIVSINGDPIFTQRQARLLVAGASPGDQIDVVGFRDGRRFETTITAAERSTTPE
jgi:S1-C subfamily serine protease